MNRYLIEGLIRDLHAGKTIMLVAPNMATAAHTFTQTAEAMRDDEAVLRVKFARGQECIEMRNEARLVTRAANGKAGRGFTGDVLVAQGYGEMTSTQRDDVRQYAAITGAELVTA